MVLPNFEENLNKYAHLIAKTGVNVQDGHTVLLTADVDQAHLARMVVKEAYQLGATEVVVQWTDDIVNRERMEHTPTKRLTDIPQFKIDESLYYLEKGASRISLRSSDPDALSGIDSEKIAAFLQENNLL